MPETIFRAENIEKQYKKAFGRKISYALDGLNMEIQKGDVYGFVGKNGAGKTTLIRILAGLVTPTKGVVEIFGERNPKTLYIPRSRINGIIETPAITPSLTAQDNMEICCIRRGIKDKSCIDKAFEAVGLKKDEVKEVKTKNFSLGMKQRLGIAMALLGEPEFLFFDEPFNGLDPVGIREFTNLIKMLNKERGITVLVSSHQLDELKEIATCYGFIHKGKMLEQVSLEDLEQKFNRYMRIQADNVEAAEKILKETLHITKIESVSHNTIHLYERLNKGAEISKALIMGGVNVEEIAVEGESLKKYYLSLVEAYDKQG
ncbi:MAG: ATP-binding cassette domain-containing protein [Candidatus Gastranaerophilales bacterium]|nr:ATP-binding cassette domain-containing protein [Candidatus Gastranaerophilales bacterium]